MESWWNFSKVIHVAAEGYEGAMSVSPEKEDSTENMEVELQSEQFQRHCRHPFHLGLLKKYHGKAKGVGSCGDAVEISLQLSGETIVAIGQLPHGCAFTTACASVVSVLALGRSIDEVLLITPEDVEVELGGLPEDHRHCARLAVNTLGEALESACRKKVGFQPKKE